MNLTTNFVIGKSFRIKPCLIAESGAKHIAVILQCRNQYSSAVEDTT